MHLTIGSNHLRSNDGIMSMRRNQQIATEEVGNAQWMT
jgi:hypothetical protein